MFEMFGAVVVAICVVRRLNNTSSTYLIPDAKAAAEIGKLIKHDLEMMSQYAGPGEQNPVNSLK